ncbi:chemotaxis protein CheY [Microbacterium sp. W1N]|uniref:chemotaxis protein CheY n=1 Tax=Microbacterium festucae TaxID=2977531 RepID=UPI0021C212F0|nr:chemotaxis protein CheY [Microbacterium festucae]MCT9821052.1 chemotaxis protein CheY [Microbacterium festucae]
MTGAGRGVLLAWAPVPDGTARRETSRALLRGLLAQTGHPDAVIAQRCGRCGSDGHGALTVAGAAWRASASYAGGLAVVAVAPATGIAALGIDAEPVDDAVRDAAGWQGVVTGGLTQWVRVEAALKADGRGLAVAPQTVRVTAHADGWTARVPGSAHTYAGWEPAAPAGLVVSVAVREEAAAARHPATA